MSYFPKAREKDKAMMEFCLSKVRKNSNEGDLIIKEKKKEHLRHHIETRQIKYNLSAYNLALAIEQSRANSRL